MSACCPKCEISRRPRREPDERLVERPKQPGAVAVHDDLDERATDEVRRRRSSVFSRSSSRPRSSGVSPEQHRRAQRRRPRCRRRARGERRATRAAARRWNGSAWNSESSQRSSASPSSWSSSAASSLPRTSAASRPRNSSSRVGSPSGCVGGDRQHRADAVRPPVEPLEEHRPRGDRPGRREPERGHRVGELARRVGRLRLALAQAALELDHREAVGLAAEVRRQQSLRLGPVRGELAGRGVAHAQPVAEVDRRADRDADERRDGRVGVSLAEERPLELGVRVVERARRPSRSRRTPSAVEIRSGRTTVRKSASSSFARGPACARAKIRAAGSRAQVLEREPRVLALRERGRARLEEPCARAAGTRTARDGRATRAPRTRTAGPRRRTGGTRASAKPRRER